METRENELAEYRQRAVATFIDYFLQAFFHVWFLMQFGKKSVLSDGRPFYDIEGPLAAVPLIVWFITFPLLESFEGKTLGKHLMKIRVIRMDGSKPDLLVTLKRRMCDWIDFALLGLPAIIISTNNPMRKRLGDLFAKTIVIKDISVV